MTLRAEPKSKKSSQNGRRNNDQEPRRGLIGRALFFCLKWGFVAAVWGLLAVLAIAAWYARELPDITRSPNIARKPSITVLGNDGSVIARYGDIKGANLTISELPPHLIQAVLATEDRRFYYHIGVDPIGMLRAVVVNLTHHGVVQGGSTITQQLAKNLFLTQDRTFKRKIQEALLALWLEKELTKDEILAAYLNRVYMGSGAYGVDAASQVYFKKSARDVNLREAAILAGLLKAPSKFSPRSNPGLSEDRANVVIANMKDAGYLEDDGVKKAVGTPTPRRKPTVSNNAQYFADYVVEQLDDLIGAQDKDIVIETTFDPDVQQGAADSLATVLREQGPAKRASQGSIIVMHRDGAVLAMVGGKDYEASQFNRATHALRPPGSSFKPVVYLTALEAGLTPDSEVNDEPITEGDYKPTNFDDKYYGTLPLKNALALSLNTVAVRLMAWTGTDAVINSARKLGITADLVPNLSTALGANGVPQIEMTNAYAILANGGLGVQPYSINKISDSTGNVLYTRKPTTDYPRLFSEHAMNDLVSMMQGVIEFGTGQAAKIGGFAAGKTGTSQDYRDAWFSGFNDHYVTTVWIGNDDNSTMKRVTGGSLPAVIWRDTMIAAMNDPTPAPDETPVATRSAFGTLIDRVLSFPTNNDEGAGGIFDGGSPGTAYDQPGNDNDGGHSIFWWRNKNDAPRDGIPAQGGNRRYNN